MNSAPASRRDTLIQFIVLILLLLAAGYFRFTGLMWGDYEYPHPDERFLVWVVADISPVDTIGAYFDTANSSLNPVNRGHTFYVYGDFPVIITRYVAESMFDQVGWMEILQVGRGISAFLDLLTVLLVYLITQRLTNWKWATLAGFFSAAAVLQIQQAHFFTSDAFAVFFSTLTVYFGVLLVTEPEKTSQRRILVLSLAFGAAVGMAMACKINTAVVAALLPAALFIRLLRSRQDRVLLTMLFAGYAVAGGIVALLVFRVAMPYAFSGPGFFGVLPAASWTASLNELRAQSAGDVDFPPGLQWARRSHLFSLKNMVLWGLGLPLGALAWLGFLIFLWRAVQRMSKPELSILPAEDTAPDRMVDAAVLDAEPVELEAASLEHLPAEEAQPDAELSAYETEILGFLSDEPVGLKAPAEEPPARQTWLTRLLTPTFSGVLLVGIWTGAYFLWQSMAFNPTMRYQLPIYPTLCVFAAWGLSSLWRHPHGNPRRWKAGVGLAGALVLILTLAWAYGFTNMYNRTETRVAATHWIFENVPGPVNLIGQRDGKEWKQLLPVTQQVSIQPGRPYLVQFDNGQTGTLASVSLPSTRVTMVSGTVMILRGRIYDPAKPLMTLASGEVRLTNSASFDNLALPALAGARLEAGKRYTLAVELVGADGATTNQADPNISTAMAQFNGTLSLSLYGRVQTVAFQAGQIGTGELLLTEDSTLRQIRLPDGSNISAVTIFLQNPQTGQQQMANAVRQENSALPVLRVEPPMPVTAGVRYSLAVASAIPGLELDPSQPVSLDFFDQPVTQSLPGLVELARTNEPLWTVFSANQNARVEQVTVGHVAQMEAGAPTGLTVELYAGNSPTNVLARARAEIPPASSDPRGEPLTITLDTPVELAQNQTYNLSITPDGGSVAVRGSAPVNESTWDMGLPFRMDGYDPYGGIYRNDLNFEMYWDDNADKLQRFLTNLDQGDYIFMSSNRQWGTTTRVPERYPLTTRYYSELMGCPEDMDVVSCYNIAEVGTFQGRLGFDLVKVVTSYPNIGPFQINDQFAEEAFTVYDHPKVLIFKKRGDYNQANVRALLGSVDLTKVVHVKPKEAAGYKDLLLPASRWAVQQAGGTWSRLFPPGGLLNQIPALGAGIWYLFLLLLGALTYPIVRLALPGLPDRGYPLARTVGLVLLAYIAWISGSLGVQVTRTVLTGVFLLIAAAGILMGSLQREGLAAELRERRGYFLAVEGLALGLFLIFLFIRLGNPDLWHPIFGGEKPMDFSYFNAVLKSSTFPPYDPWFAGGYINYYYYGFVLVGMPVKLLGIDPTIAYNLILPMLFMIVGLGAFSVGTNLYASARAVEKSHDADADESMDGALSTWISDSPVPARLTRAALWTGLAAVLALLILGNLGTVRMYWRGFQKLVVPEEQITNSGPITQTTRVIQGIGKMVSGEAKTLPYYPGDWYWKPSRAIQPESGNEITEFPFFTFLYADLHAHLMALPVTILVIGWALGVLLGKGCWGLSGGRKRVLSLALALLIGALATGMLRPANTWDQYTYLALASIALFYAQFRAGPETGGQGWQQGWWHVRWIRALLPVLVLVGLALLFYKPFDTWFAQGYNSLVKWEGAKTALTSYLVHWGLFLFVIAAWLFEETVRWMAETPLSALSKLRPQFAVYIAGTVALVVAIVVLVAIGVHIALVAVPLGIWVTALLFRPGLPAAKRAVLFMTGTALALTIAVELVAVKGDIGRMNTVFKFYYQAWTMLALSAAAGLVWLWPRLQLWMPGWRTAWQFGLGLLAFGAALFPVHAAQAKITDRMVPTAPHTLDGMQYMNYATYTDGPDAETMRDLDLSADYRAIRWAQAYIPGSPVIVEANTPEYRHWGTRFTIYTGLPGVVGWNWHQRQQRTVTPDTWVFDRITDVGAFYRTTSLDAATGFLKKYNVQYIILGQLERVYYNGPGLEKFTEQDGKLWEKVYEEGETVIYRVR